MRRAWLVYNPAAGRLPPTLVLGRVVRALQAWGWQVVPHEARNAEHVTHLARQAAQAGLEALFVAGGDGTLGRAAAGLMGSATALGVIPTGTANVFAQELGLPTFSWTNWWGLEHSARLLARAPILPMDLGLCNETPFLLWAGAGLDAAVIHRLEPRRRWEKPFTVPQYATLAVWLATTQPPLRLKVTVEGRTLADDFLLAVASNIRRYAGGIATLTPRAYLDDGVMELWLFRGRSLEDAARRAWELWRGQHLRSSEVLQLPFTQARLESEGPLSFQLDGEPYTFPSTVTLRVVPQALRVLVPPTAARHLFRRAAGQRLPMATR